MDSLSFYNQYSRFVASDCTQDPVIPSHALSRSHQTRAMISHMDSKLHPILNVPCDDFASTISGALAVPKNPSSASSSNASQQTASSESGSFHSGDEIATESLYPYSYSSPYIYSRNSSLILFNMCPGIDESVLAVIDVEQPKYIGYIPTGAAMLDLVYQPTDHSVFSWHIDNTMRKIDLNNHRVSSLINLREGRRSNNHPNLIYEGDVKNDKALCCCLTTCIYFMDQRCQRPTQFSFTGSSTDYDTRQKQKSMGGICWTSEEYCFVTGHDDGMIRLWDMRRLPTGSTDNIAKDVLFEKHVYSGLKNDKSPVQITAIGRDLSGRNLLINTREQGIFGLNILSIDQSDYPMMHYQGGNNVFYGHRRPYYYPLLQDGLTSSECFVVAPSESHTIRVWNAETAEQVHSFHAPEKGQESLHVALLSTDFKHAIVSTNAYLDEFRVENQVSALDSPHARAHGSSSGEESLQGDLTSVSTSPQPRQETVSAHSTTSEVVSSSTREENSPLDSNSTCKVLNIQQEILSQMQMHNAEPDWMVDDRPRDALCTFDEGYSSQQIYSCLQCSSADSPAGMCRNCAEICHSGHNVIPIGMKSGFRCDCGSEKFPNHPCRICPKDGVTNENNKYNHNFHNRWCTCDGLEGSIMYQCFLCEDWFHPLCLGLTDAQANDDKMEDVALLCRQCEERISPQPLQDLIRFIHPDDTLESGDETCMGYMAENGKFILSHRITDFRDKLSAESLNSPISRQNARVLTVQRREEDNESQPVNNDSTPSQASESRQSDILREDSVDLIDTDEEEEDEDAMEADEEGMDDFLV